jgi:hypothetical protein
MSTASEYEREKREDGRPQMAEKTTPIPVEGGNNDKNQYKKKKSGPTPSSLIDHTYYDYSTRQLSELLSPTELENFSKDGQRLKGRITFPTKLYDVISNPVYR